MALQPHRLRRVLSSLSTFHRCFSITTPTPISPPRLLPEANPSPSAFPFFSVLQCRTFVGSRASAMAAGKRELKLYKEGDEITEDTILFEGCDYNHWLITMEFPKDPSPSPEEMVAAYEQTCAKGLNISIEEAKKRIYACSTTTYIGFQAVMTEEESEKFQDLPGVVFVLPDSYIDVVNKEYGGDKYENGVITRRPPPVYYQPGRRGGTQRNYEQNRSNPYDRQGGPMQNQQGSPYRGQQGPQYGQQGAGGNYGQTPQQMYGPPGQGEGRPFDNYGQIEQNRNYGQRYEQQGGPMQNQQGSPYHGQQGPRYGQQGSFQGAGGNYGQTPQQQYSPPRQGEGRPVDNYGQIEHNRNYGQRYDQQGGPMQNQQGSPYHGQHGPQYGQQGSFQGAGGNHGQTPQQQYSPPRQGEGRPVDNYGQIEQNRDYGQRYGQPGGPMQNQQGLPYHGQQGPR